jgi:hypothetical protein
MCRHKEAAGALWKLRIFVKERKVETILAFIKKGWSVTLRQQ